MEGDLIHFDALCTLKLGISTVDKMEEGCAGCAPAARMGSTHSGSSAPSLQPVDQMEKGCVRAARLSTVQQHAPGTFTPSPALPSSTPLPPPAVAQLLERDDTVRRSTILWASPLHMVAKKDGSWRPCSDFQ